MGKTAALCALLLLACTHPRPGAISTEKGLVSSVEAAVGGDSVRLELHVTNTSNRPIALEFPTTQRYDFVVSQGGQEVWRWSGGQMFGQLVGHETLQAGETRDFTAKLKIETRSGVFSAIARLTSSNQTVEQRTNFEIAKR